MKVEAWVDAKAMVDVCLKAAWSTGGGGMIRKAGDLQVWWIPQVPMKKLFEVDVSSVKEGVAIMNALSEYDLFQFRNGIKPDYCNAGGLRRWCADNGDGVQRWEDWYDEETGEDDPVEYLLTEAAEKETP